MHTEYNQRGDDGFFNRLLTYLRKNFYEPIIKFTQIRQYVYYLETSRTRLILKGFKSHKLLKLQETFTATLKSEGFLRTYLFIPPPAKELLFFEGFYWGCIEYIPTHRKAFSFESKKERTEGLELITDFHQVTSIFEKRYRTIIYPFMAEKKWKERTSQFIGFLPTIKRFLNEEVISELISWTRWSFKGIEKSGGYFLEEPYVILHGDLAHHNFLRAATGELKLIDFDLISIGPNLLDLIQYSNRILPSLDWSLNSLVKYEQISKNLKNAAFVYSLAFPADIFREWNKICREKTYLDSLKVKQIIGLTLNQFQERQKFIRELRSMVK